MVMTLIMLTLIGVQLMFILSALRYLRSLKIGLMLSSLIEPDQIPLSMSTISAKAEIDYAHWGTWRNSAIISLIVTIILWWGFYIGSTIDTIFLAVAALSIGWTLTSALVMDFSPEWIIEWHDKLIRIHDTITIDYIHDRMAIIAEQLQRQDDGEITLTSIENSTIQYEIAKMAELIVAIGRRNPDLVTKEFTSKA